MMAAAVLKRRGRWHRVFHTGQLAVVVSVHWTLIFLIGPQHPVCAGREQRVPRGSECVYEAHRPNQCPK